MIKKVFCLLGCLLVLGCASFPKQANQTLAGMDQTHVLISAQHALAIEGYKVESIDAGSGTIITKWNKKNKVQTQYKVTVAPAKEVGFDCVDVKVSAQTKEKTIGGWSSAQDSSSSNLDNILEKIVELSVKRFKNTDFSGSSSSNISSNTPKPECITTSDCPARNYCNSSNKCTYDCSVDAQCEDGKKCDQSGRCLASPAAILSSDLPTSPVIPSGNKEEVN